MVVFFAGFLCYLSCTRNSARTNRNMYWMQNNGLGSNVVSLYEMSVLWRARLPIESIRLLYTSDRLCNRHFKNSTHSTTLITIGRWVNMSWFFPVRYLRQCRCRPHVRSIRLYDDQLGYYGLWAYAWIFMRVQAARFTGNIEKREKENKQKKEEVKIRHTMNFLNVFFTLHSVAKCQRIQLMRK